MNFRELAEDVICIVLQLYKVESTIPITPVLDEVEKTLETFVYQNGAYLFASGFCVGTFVSSILALIIFL